MQTKLKKTVVALLSLALFISLAGCKKNDPASAPTDAYAAFKADATPRWESGATVEKNHEGTSYVFITDTGGKLFSSGKYKLGRITASDGSNYEIVEFDGLPAVGHPSGAAIRKPSGSVTPHRLEIVKVANGTLWIVFQETETSPERKIVH